MALGRDNINGPIAPLETRKQINAERGRCNAVQPVLVGVAPGTQINLLVTGNKLFAVEVLIDDEMLQRAKRKADDLGLLKHSILGGKGNLAGFLGEEMFLNTFPGSFSENTYQHDINYLGSKIEIKTVQTTVFPSLDFNCHVAAYNAKQRADRYVFARVLKSYDFGWLMGWMDVNDFKDLSRKANKGDRDGDFVFTIDCFNLRYRELEPFYSLLETT